MKTKTQMAILTLLMGLSLSMVVFGTQGVQSSSNPVRQSTSQSTGIIVDMPSDVSDLNPALSSDWYSLYVSQGAVAGLYALKSNAATPLKWWIQDVAVKNLETSADGLDFNLTLKSGLVWENGEPLNATDLVYTYQMNLLEGLGLRSSGSLIPYFPNNATLTVGDTNFDIYPLNATTVHFHLNEYINYPEINIFGVYLLPYHIFKGLPQTSAAWTNDITNTGTGATRTVTLSSGSTYTVIGMVGNGPYKYAGSTATPTYSLTLNTNFQATLLNMTAPTIPSITIQIQSSPTGALSDVTSGQVSFVDSNSGLQGSDIFNALNSSSTAHPVTLLSSTAGMQELGYNQYSSIFGMNPGDPNIMYGEGPIGAVMGSESISQAARVNNAAWIAGLQTASATGNMSWFYTHLTPEDRFMVRQALDTAMPRDSIISSIFNGFGQTVATHVLADMQGYDDTIQAREYSATQAKGNLSAVFGYTFVGGDSTTNGTPYFTANVIVPNSRPDRVQWASLITQSWSQIGLLTPTLTLPFPTLISRMFPEVGVNTPSLGADFAHGGMDIGFIGWGGGSPLFNGAQWMQTPESLPPDGNGYYFVNATIDNPSVGYNNPVALWNLTQNMTKAPAVVAAAVARYQQWAFENIPYSVIAMTEVVFGVANNLQGFNPFEVWNYNEWSIGTTPTTTGTTGATGPTTVTQVTTSVSTVQASFSPLWILALAIAGPSFVIVARRKYRKN